VRPLKGVQAAAAQRELNPAARPPPFETSEKLLKAAAQNKPENQAMG
jgi:hypothetical protein